MASQPPGAGISMAGTAVDIPGPMAYGEPSQLDRMSSWPASPCRAIRAVARRAKGPVRPLCVHCGAMLYILSVRGETEAGPVRPRLSPVLL